MKRNIEKKKTVKSSYEDHLLKVKFVELNPDPTRIPDKDLIVVREKGGRTKWAYMRCPSGCGDTLMLSLQRGDYPSWRLTINKNGQPSLFPSIWKKDGCRSHFYLLRGKIVYITTRYRKRSLIPSSLEGID